MGRRRDDGGDSRRIIEAMPPFLGRGRLSSNRRSIRDGHDTDHETPTSNAAETGSNPPALTSGGPGHDR